MPEAMNIGPISAPAGSHAFGYREGNFPIAEAVARELIVPPIYPKLEHSQVDHVARTLRDALGRA